MSKEWNINDLNEVGIWCNSEKEIRFVYRLLASVCGSNQYHTIDYFLGMFSKDPDGFMLYLGSNPLIFMENVHRQSKYLNTRFRFFNVNPELELTDDLLAMCVLGFSPFIPVEYG